MINLIKKKIKFIFFIFNYYLKLFFESLYFLNKKKVKNVDAVFAYTDYTNQDGAYGYLHYLIKMISKYSRFSYKNLNSFKTINGHARHIYPKKPGFWFGFSIFWVWVLVLRASNQTQISKKLI